MKNNLPLTNYNIFALQGDDSVDDMDVVETLGLDPKVAYTPNINDAAIQRQYNENVDSYVARGMTQDEANALAKTHADAAKASVRAAMRSQAQDFQF
jgi:hypothetical protein